jgi:hypothetical protein
MHPAVTETGVINILVPKLSTTDRIKIKQKILDAGNLRQQSDNLLDEFKKQTELSIVAPALQSYTDL